MKIKRSGLERTAEKNGKLTEPRIAGINFVGEKISQKQLSRSDRHTVSASSLDAR
jgi:hypothetical protein